MDFLNSGLGQYIVQSTFHSLVIVIVVEAMISAWRIGSIRLQSELRLLALLLPVVYLPLYYLVYPARTGLDFHQNVALIDSNQWLQLEWGGVAVWHFFVALLALTTVYFIVKEAIPSIRYYFWQSHSLPLIEEGQFPKLDSALSRLSEAIAYPMPPLFLSDEDEPVIYSRGRGGVVLSARTIDMLDDEELKASIGHELGHLRQQASMTNRLSQVLRFVMFYNPVALFVFRRVINDNEKICDDMAVALTGNRLAVASGLLKIFRSAEPGTPQTIVGGSGSWFPVRISALEDRAYSGLVRDRVDRMVHPEEAADVPYQSFRVFLIAGLLAGLLFFVV